MPNNINQPKPLPVFTHLNQTTLKSAIQEIIHTHPKEFKLTDLYPYFNVELAKEAVEEIVSPMGYKMRIEKDKSIVFIKENPIKNLNIESVVLSPEKKKEIQATIAQEQNKQLIFEEWGFNEVLEKGMGMTLLFYGSSGTGKSLMAEAIANELGLGLKKLDMNTMSSYLWGETEKNITKAFISAESSPENKKDVILIDECDSLLYNRDAVGPIVSSQVNILLSEIERYEGIVILTTNRLGKLDPALERRITTKIEFPFPNESERKLIWERLIPKKAPIGKDVDFEILAKIPLSGGNIKNTILMAARKCAYDKAKTISMKYFVDAIKKEKQEKESFSALSDKPSSSVSNGTSMKQDYSLLDEDREINIDKVIGDKK